MDRNRSVPKLPPQLPQVYFPTRPISDFDSFGKESFKSHRSSEDTTFEPSKTISPIQYGRWPQSNLSRDVQGFRVATAAALDGAYDSPAADDLDVVQAGLSKALLPGRVEREQGQASSGGRIRASRGIFVNVPPRSRRSSKARFKSGEDDEMSLIDHARDLGIAYDAAQSKRDGKRPARDLVRGGEIASDTSHDVPHITRTSPTPRRSAFANSDPDAITPATLNLSRQHLIVPSWRHARPSITTRPTRHQSATSEELQNTLVELQKIQARKSPQSSTDSFQRVYCSTMADRANSIPGKPPMSEVVTRDFATDPASHYALKEDIEAAGRSSTTTRELRSAFDHDDGFRPDHSRSGWLQAIFGMLAIMNCWGLNLSYGVFEAYYKMTFLSNHSHGAIAWIGSVQLSLIFLTAIVVGHAYDYGFVRPFFHIGSLSIVGAIMTTAECTSWHQLFWAQGVWLGISMGCVFCSGVLVLMEYFDKKLGTAVAFGAAGSSVGGIAYTLMAQHLLPSVGFPWTMRAIGFVALATLIPSNILHKPRYPNKNSTRSKPSLRFLRDPAFLFMVLGMFFSFWSLYFGFYYIVSYACNVLHLSPSMSINVLLAMLTANLPGRFLPAILSDTCIGPLNTLVPGCFITAAVLFLWIGINNTGGLFILAAFYGFASAGPQAMFGPATAAFLDVQDDGSMDPAKGLKSAVVFVAIGVACATGAPIGGALIDRGAKHAPDGMPYLYGQVFAGTAMAAAGMCFLASRTYRVGWRPGRT